MTDLRPVPSATAPLVPTLLKPEKISNSDLQDSASDPQASQPNKLSPKDEADCKMLDKADFSGTDPRCGFPDRPTGSNTNQSPNSASGNGSNINGVSQPSLKDSLLSQEKFGEVVDKPGDRLLDRTEELETASPEERATALAEAGTKAGLSEATQKAATELLAALPPEKQAEATAYIEELFSTRNLGDARTGQLLGQIKDMAGQTYDPRVGSSADLAVSALHDVAAPLAIDQGFNTGTCSVTAMQTALAQSQPERYLKMVDTLAQNKPFEGIEPDWSFVDEGQFKETDRGRETITGDTYRSPTAKLVQNALMEYAGGAEDYTSAVDGINTRPVTNDEAWLAGTLDATLKDGKNYVMYHIDNGEYPESDKNKNMSADQILKAVAEYQPSPDRPLVMSYSDPEHGSASNPMGHAGLIIGSDGSTVTYVDPIEGVTKKVSVEELAKHIWSIQIPFQK
jgi:hypothetical protein